VKRKKDVSIGLVALVSLVTISEKLARGVITSIVAREIRHVALTSALFRVRASCTRERRTCRKQACDSLDQ